MAASSGRARRRRPTPPQREAAWRPVRAPAVRLASQLRVSASATRGAGTRTEPTQVRLLRSLALAPRGSRRVARLLRRRSQTKERVCSLLLSTAEARSGFDCFARWRSLYLIARSARCDVRRKPPSSSNPTKPPLTWPALATTRFVGFSCRSAAGTSRARIAPWSPPTSSTLAHERACLLAPSTLLAPLAEAGAWWPLPSSLARRRKTPLLPRSSRTAARQPGSARRRRDPDKRLRLVDESAGGDGRHAGRQRSRIHPRQWSGSFQFATSHIPDDKTGHSSPPNSARVVGEGCPVCPLGCRTESGDDTQPLARLPMLHRGPHCGPACERGHRRVRAERERYAGPLQSAQAVHCMCPPRTKTVLVELARLAPRRVEGWLHAGHYAQVRQGRDVWLSDHLDMLQAMPRCPDAPGTERLRSPAQARHGSGHRVVA